MSEMFNYSLPKELIAQYPLKEREKARFMVVDRKTDEIYEKIFADIPKFIKQDEVLVLNDAKVIPARIYGKKETGGKVEVFLLRKIKPYIWEVLLRGKVKTGSKVIINKIVGVVEERTEKGSFLIRFNTDNDEELKRSGEVPLPAYIKRKPVQDDKEYYQTVYAKKEGAVAAPTAGLHFTDKLLETLKKKGVKIVFITLFIGWASFKLVREEKDGDLSVPEELYEIPEETSEIINKAKMSGKRIIAVGTSCVRALESSVRDKKVVPQKKYTGLFIKPGFNFRIIDALITNFHLPCSTHLYMVSAFGGSRLIEKVYKIAVEKKYRFYSYGDAMLIE